MRGGSDHYRPPQAAEFLLLLVPLKQRENILGDLEEEFGTLVAPSMEFS
jgi:hypothetical protein